MSLPTPIYTARNCSPAYQLNWAISLFGHAGLPSPASWLESVRSLLEGDGVRVLEHCLGSPGALLFLVSTKSDIAPCRILQRLKGRIQYAIRATKPRAFRRNYRVESVGSAKQAVLNAYVAK